MKNKIKKRIKLSVESVIYAFGASVWLGMIPQVKGNPLSFAIVFCMSGLFFTAFFNNLHKLIYGDKTQILKDALGWERGKSFALQLEVNDLTHELEEANKSSKCSKCKCKE